MAEMTRNEFITARMAEGFTKEAAEHAYDHTYDPAIAAAQEQKVPTKGEMLVRIAEARQKNPDKKTLYKPDFSISEPVLKLTKELEALKGKTPYDSKAAQGISRQIMSLKIHGTITDEMRQAEIDKTLEMSLAELFTQYKKYGKIMTECEEKIDSFDISKARAKIDALEAEYKKKAAARGQFAQNFDLNEKFNKEADLIEFNEVTKPLNDLKIKRYEAVEYFCVYEARIKFYVQTNKPLIEEEVTAARRDEIRGSLADLVEYMEE